jgi:hypothetical protein
MGGPEGACSLGRHGSSERGESGDDALDIEVRRGGLQDHLLCVPGMAGRIGHRDESPE